MRKFFSILFTAFLAGSASAQNPAGDLVLVEGGNFKNSKSNYYGKILTVSSFVGRALATKTFFIGKYEVTQKEWTEVMGSNPSKFRGDDLPVESVSWYDSVEYCNQRSEKEGLKPYYTIEKEKKDPNNHTVIDDRKWTVTINAGSDGYRLPTEAEWEYAASGGQLSRGFTYAGSDDLDTVAWYWQNAGDTPQKGQWHWPTIEKNHTKTKAVGGKKPNELGLFDMSGNVREWCWDWYGELEGSGAAPTGSSSETGRVWKGGGWIGADFCCATAFRAGLEANGRGADQGFRVCRSK